MYTHSETQTHSFSHLLSSLFVPHLSGGVELGCSGQGWHALHSFAPTNTCTHRHVFTDTRTHNKNREGLAL